jgi:hypothetical protein
MIFTDKRVCGALLEGQGKWEGKERGWRDGGIEIDLSLGGGGGSDSLLIEVH